MKTILSAFAMALLSMSVARGSGAITVEIRTTGAEIRYTLHTFGVEGSKESIKPEEIEVWLRENTGKGRPYGESGQELVIIDTDERTSYITVLGMLKRIKAAGVKMFAITTFDGKTMNSVSGDTKKIQEHPIRDSTSK